MTGSLRVLAAKALACLALLVPAAQAQNLVPVPPLSGRVVDQTNTLSSAQAQAITTKLAAIESKRGSQLVVLIVPTTAPEDIESFTQRVGDAWKLGRRGRRAARTAAALVSSDATVLRRTVRRYGAAPPWPIGTGRRERSRELATHSLGVALAAARAAGPSGAR